MIGRFKYLKVSVQLAKVLPVVRTMKDGSAQFPRSSPVRKKKTRCTFFGISAEQIPRNCSGTGTELQPNVLTYADSDCPQSHPPENKTSLVERPLGLQPVALEHPPIKRDSHSTSLIRNDPP
jgi:hypothetical protein